MVVFCAKLLQKFLGKYVKPEMFVKMAKNGNDQKTVDRKRVSVMMIGKQTQVIN